MASYPTPRTIGEAALANRDQAAVDAVMMMFGFLGIFAGNIALTIGAFGGVFIAGGTAQRLQPLMDASPFRDRFEDKGRFTGYLGAIPTYLITHPNPAFIGLAGLLTAPDP